MFERLIYNNRFYENQGSGSYKSAKKVIPMVIKTFTPKSVVDVGCGIGTWLKVFEENNIQNFIGIDGDYVNKNKLVIDKNKFLSRDISKPIEINKKFDLALCLEVGEHISKKKSEILVKSLCELAPIVLFSSALPGQGGDNHINEQWPDYWKNIFLRFGFIMFDPIRKYIYNDNEIEWWYRQNIFVVIRKDKTKYYKNKLGFIEVGDILMIHKSIIKKNFGILNSLVTIIRYPYQRLKKTIRLIK